MHRAAKRALRLIMKAVDHDPQGQGLEACADEREAEPCTCLLEECGCGTLSQDLAERGYSADEIAAALLDGAPEASGDATRCAVCGALLVAPRVGLSTCGATCQDAREMGVPGIAQAALVALVLLAPALAHATAEPMPAEGGGIGGIVAGLGLALVVGLLLHLRRPLALLALLTAGPAAAGVAGEAVPNHGGTEAALAWGCAPAPEPPSDLTDCRYDLQRCQADRSVCTGLLVHADAAHPSRWPWALLGGLLSALLWLPLGAWWLLRSGAARLDIGGTEVHWDATARHWIVTDRANQKPGALPPFKGRRSLRQALRDAWRLSRGVVLLLLLCSTAHAASTRPDDPPLTPVRCPAGQVLVRGRCVRPAPPRQPETCQLGVRRG